jgi:hypothetical protein
MKTFKIEGWYRYNDEKDFEQLKINTDTPESAVYYFKEIYSRYNFHKIDIKEIL